MRLKEVGTPELKSPPPPGVRLGAGYADGAVKAPPQPARKARRRRAPDDFSDLEPGALDARDDEPGEPEALGGGSEEAAQADGYAAPASTSAGLGKAKGSSLPSEKGGRRAAAGVGAEAAAPGEAGAAAAASGAAAPGGAVNGAPVSAAAGALPYAAGAAGPADGAPAAGAAGLPPLSSLDGESISGMMEKRLDIGAYRIQLSETPDFSAPIFDKSFDAMSPIDLLAELQREGIAAERDAYWVRIAFIDLLAIEEPFTKPRLYGLDKRRR